MAAPPQRTLGRVVRPAMEAGRRTSRGVTYDTIAGAFFKKKTRPSVRGRIGRVGRCMCVDARAASRFCSRRVWRTMKKARYNLPDGMIISLPCFVSDLLIFSI